MGDLMRDQNQTRNPSGRNWPALALATTLVGGGIIAATSACDETEPPDSASEVANAVSMSLLYEGTCEYLLQCSAPSTAAGSVLWGCPTNLRQQSGCTNSMIYLAAPNSEFCGLTIRICRGSTCTTGIVQDVSNKGTWEAGDAVMNALGNYPVPPVACGERATGTITADVKSGSWGTATVTPVGATTVAYFGPGLSGYHAVEFVTDRNLSGTAELCWRDGLSASFSCWTNEQVTQQLRRIVLYSGSNSINYRITFRAPANGQIKYRFYTAPGL